MPESLGSVTGNCYDDVALGFGIQNFQELQFLLYMASYTGRWVSLETGLHCV